MAAGAACCSIAAVWSGAYALLAVFLPLTGVAVALVLRAYRYRRLRDPFTGLPNAAALAEAASKDPVATVVVARIDRYGPVTSCLDQNEASQLVRQVAARLSLANPEHRIYRLDDESLAWTEAARDRLTMADRLEAVVAVMKSAIDCGHRIDVTLTLGMADNRGDDIQQLLGNAAVAARHAARKGLRWERFSEDESHEVDWHLSLLGELDAAMASGQVWNAYQPKLDIATGEIIGAEALVRWLHPQRGPIAPDNFIPLVEEHGRARDLTFHVLVKALEDAASWERGGRPIGVAVNLSAALLAEDDFIDQIRQTLQHSPVPPERLTVEISESAVIHDSTSAVMALQSWRELGVNISIDDYGTGQSNLGYLQKLLASEIKIDRSFVQTIGNDGRNAVMVRSTISLAHELGMKIVAEGVENQACLDMLRDFGCDTGQGFYIGRPMSAGNLSVFLGGNAREAA